MDVLGSMVKKKVAQEMGDTDSQQTTKAANIVKLSHVKAFGKETLERFKSSRNLGSIDELEEEVATDVPTWCTKCGTAVTKILDFFVKLRLIGKIILTVQVIGVIAMMLVIGAGATVWEISSEQVKERMIELIEDDAHDQVERLGFAMKGEVVEFFEHYLVLLVSFQFYARFAFFTNPLAVNEETVWSSDIVLTQDELQDRDVIYDYPAYHHVDLSKNEVLFLYGDTLDLLKNLHDDYVNLPQLGGFNLFIGDEETGIFQIYPAQQVPDGFNFKSREWYWLAVENQGEAVLTSPYYDAVSQILVITISKAIYDVSGNLQRVIGIDFLWSQIVESINQPNELYNAFVFMTTNLGTVISAPKIWGGAMDGPYVIYLQPGTGFTQDSWHEYTHQKPEIDIDIPTKGKYTWLRNDLQIVGTLFFLGICYEKANTAEFYEDGLKEYRSLHITLDSIVFVVLFLLILTLFVYFSFYRLNADRKEIRERSLTLMKYSIEPQMFGDKLYSTVQVKSKTELMTRLWEKLEELRMTEVDNLQWNTQVWTRPVNHYKYDEYLNQNNPRQAENQFWRYLINDMREANQRLPEHFRGNTKPATIENPSIYQYLPQGK